MTYGGGGGGVDSAAIDITKRSVVHVHSLVNTVRIQQELSRQISKHLPGEGEGGKS